MANPIFQISDGTAEGTVDLLGRRGGLIIKKLQYEPPKPKNDGVWFDSPLQDGRKLVNRQYTNPILTLTVGASEDSQDKAIEDTQDLRRLLQEASDYWTNRFSKTPVWIVMRGPEETNTTYAVIKDWRVIGDKNPFEQPFFGWGRQKLIDDLDVVLEIGMPQDVQPGTGRRVAISTRHDLLGVNMIGGDFSNIAAGSDDGIAVRRSGYFDNSSTVFNLGYYSITNDSNAVFLRFQVNFSQGTHISSAYITLISTLASSGNSARVRVSIQDTSNASAPTDADDLFSRVFLPDSIIWEIGDTNLGGTRRTVNIAPILQKIIDRKDWVSGNYVLFILEDDNSHFEGGSNEYLPFAAYEHLTYAPAQLSIQAENITTNLGAAATSTEEVFVGNYNLIETDVYKLFRYDSSAGTYTAVDGGGPLTPLPWDLFPNPPGVGDILYVSAYNAFTPAQNKFNAVIFDLSTAFTGVAVVEYWNGAAWVTLTANDTTWKTSPSGNNFERQGVCGFFWETPSDWATTIVGGFSGYWVRFRLTSAAGTYCRTIIVPYGVVTAFIEVAEDEIGGDYPALAKLELTNQSNNPSMTRADDLYATRVLVGIRSVDRGKQFSPYLYPAQYGHTPGVIKVDIYTPSSGGGGHNANFDTVYAIGEDTYKVQCHATNLFTNDHLVRWKLDPQQYSGVFRAFLRYRVTTGTTGSFSVYLVYTAGNSLNPITLDVQSLYAPTTDEYLQEMGLVDFGAAEYLDQEEILSNFTVSVYGSCTTGGAVLHIVDLILFPVDEWAGEFYAVDETSLTNAVVRNSKLDIDSIFQKLNIRSVMRNLNDVMIANYLKVTNGPMIAGNNRRSKYWFLFSRGPETARRCPAGIAYSVKLKAAARYHFLRGRR